MKKEMKRYSLPAIAMTLLVSLFVAGSAVAADFFVRPTHGASIKKRVMSMKELKFKNVVRQNTDFSCGAASLATVLRYFYEDKDVSEESIVNWLLEYGDVDKIRQRGFSLLDLKTYAEDKGYMAGGYRVDPSQLHNLNVPVIVLLDIGGYAHFVVLKGVRNRTAHIADPVLGNRKISMPDFTSSWNGLLLAVQGKKREGESNYTRFDGPVSVDRSEVAMLSNQVMRNLFINTSEFQVK